METRWPGTYRLLDVSQMLPSLSPGLYNPQTKRARATLSVLHTAARSACACPACSSLLQGPARRQQPLTPCKGNGAELTAGEGRAAHCGKTKLDQNWWPLINPHPLTSCCTMLPLRVAACTHNLVGEICKARADLPRRRLLRFLRTNTSCNKCTRHHPHCNPRPKGPGRRALYMVGHRAKSETASERLYWRTLKSGPKVKFFFKYIAFMDGRCSCVFSRSHWGW